MHSRFRTRGATLAGLLMLALAALTPSLAEAKPEPGAKRGFRLFARPLGAMTINRVLCGLTSTGNICVDSLNSSTIGGGFWPKRADVPASFPVEAATCCFARFSLVPTSRKSKGLVM